MNNANEAFSQGGAVSPVDRIRVFAKVTLDDMLIGIDTRHVVSALSRPTSLTRLPRRQGALEGAFTLNGQVVPLVDLRGWMEGQDADEQRPVPGQVMVLRAEGATLGLAIDAVNGLVRLPESSIRQVHHDNAEAGLFHSVGVTCDGQLISLLDPARLMRQTNAWADNIGQAGVAGMSDQNIGADLNAATRIEWTPSQVLVRIGTSTLGADAAVVAEVCKLPSLQQLVRGTSHLSGMMNWRGYHVPVLKPDSIIGNISVPASAASLVMVLAWKGRYVAVPVENVLGVRQFDCRCVQAPADVGLPNHGFFQGAVQLEDNTPALLIDGHVLLKRYGLDGLSSAIAGRQHEMAETRPLNPQAYVIFDAGTPWALPLSCVENVIAFPSDFRPLPDHHNLSSGSCTWRGRMLPVVDLDKNPTNIAPENSYLIIIRYQNRVAGLRVNSITSLIPANSVTLTSISLPRLGRVNILTAAGGKPSPSYRILKLDSLPFYSQTSD
nr:chemotaxis protein CheW [uncultured Noviherbaspirillum sp.]